MHSLVNARLQNIFFIGLIVATLALNLYIFRKYLLVLFFALILAVAFYPVFRFIHSGIKRWRSLAAGATLILLIVAVLIPLFFFGVVLFQEARAFALQIMEDGGEVHFITAAIERVEGAVGIVVPEFELEVDVREFVLQATGWIFRQRGAVFSGAAEFTLGLIIFCFAFFYFLKDGEGLTRRLTNAIPLNDRHSEDILRRLDIAINSVVRGTLLLALIRFGGIAAVFFVFGVPNPIFWAALGAVIAIVPGIGTMVVMTPAVLYQVFFGEIYQVVGLIIAGVVLIVAIDNFTGPRLIMHGTKVPAVLMLVSIVGGVATFGVLGFFVAPVLLSLLFELLEIYPAVAKRIEAPETSS